MALLDLSIISQANALFAFLFVWVATYGILSYSKMFDMKENIRAILSIVIALMTLMYRPALDIISAVTPWFVIIIISIIFILLTMMAFGLDMKHFVKSMETKEIGTPVKIVLIIISCIIIISAISVVFSKQIIGDEAQSAPGDVGDTGSGALVATLFSPQVLGMLFIMLTAFFAILLLAGES